jgi:hypothetical protein
MKRPRNAAPNTAFTVASEDGEIVRISLDHTVLDCKPSSTGPAFNAPVVWDITMNHLDLVGEFKTSCRSDHHYRLCYRLHSPAEVGRYLETGVKPDR